MQKVSFDICRIFYELGLLRTYKCISRQPRFENCFYRSVHQSEDYACENFVHSMPVLQFFSRKAIPLDIFQQLINAHKSINGNSFANTVSKLVQKWTLSLLKSTESANHLQV